MSSGLAFPAPPHRVVYSLISFVNFWGITSSGVTISWSTDVPSDTAVAYDTTNALSQLSPVQTALTNSHGVTLTGLAAGTTYYFAAQSADGSGNTGSSTTYSFTTLQGPPTISNVVTNPAANNKATIAWTTSVPTYSYVQYGTSAGNYGGYSPLTSLTASPNCTLGYVPSGTAHYQLVSTDAAGNQVMSPDMTFVEP